MKPSQSNHNERGIALVMAMLILMVMSLLGLVLMAGASMNRGLVGHDQRMRESLNIAEAGVGEAMARIGKLETLMDPTDPKDVCQVFNTVPGSVPVLGADSIGLATGQPVGSYLNYTTASRGPDVLTINWKKDPTGTLVMRYDRSKNPCMNTLTGSPVYVVTATGRVGNARRTVVSEVIQRPFQVNILGALTTNVGIDFTGNAVICGFNHEAGTPTADGHNGRGTAPDCADNETVGSNLPGIWTSGTVNQNGNADPFGNPPKVENQAGFYSGPWDACAMTQAEWIAWLGAPRTSVSSMNGINYLSNGTAGAIDISLHSVEGEGLLYVDGNLHVNAGFTYRGLIYCEGDFDVQGTAWILGAVIAKGQGNVKANGGMTLLYSSDAINQALSKYAGQFVTLSWREQ